MFVDIIDQQHAVNGRFNNYGDHCLHTVYDSASDQVMRVCCFRGHHYHRIMIDRDYYSTEEWRRLKYDLKVRL